MQQTHLPGLASELNYNHLYYFWVAGREGSISRAAELLLVSQPTVSVQIHSLEATLKAKLFQRAGRRLVLTEKGQTVFRYASEMFATGLEMLQSLRRAGGTTAAHLLVGVADAVPKTLVHRLLLPATTLQNLRLVCREDKAQLLLGELAADRLHLVLGDAPLGASVHLRGLSFLLAECPLSFLAAKPAVRRLSRRFPQCLDAEPMLLPSEAVAIHAPILEWLHKQRLRPLVVAEFDDAATMAVFGEGGAGVFPVPALVEREVCRKHNCGVVGRVAAITHRFYAVTGEHRMSNPHIAAICSQQCLRPA